MIKFESDDRDAAIYVRDNIMTVGPRINPVKAARCIGAHVDYKLTDRVHKRDPLKLAALHIIADDVARNDRSNAEAENAEHIRYIEDVIASKTTQKFSLVHFLSAVFQRGGEFADRDGKWQLNKLSWMRLHSVCLLYTSDAADD